MAVLGVSVITESREEEYGFDVQCTSPTRISVVIDGEEKELFVPCGHCAACRIAKKREWTIRLIHEKGYWKDTSFITLTYQDDFLPRDGGLHKEHLQGFIKRLRRSLGDRQIKYFACGEYGDRFGRPHYHAIVFGLSGEDRDKVQQCWPFGFTKLSAATIYRFQYVCGYVQKKLSGRASEEVYGSLQPPFQLQSQGLGIRYFNDHKDEILRDMACYTWTGASFGVPRYYRKKAGDEFDREQLASQSKENRRAIVRRHGVAVGPDTPDWLVDEQYYRLGMKEGSSLNRSREIADLTRRQKLEMSLDRRKVK